MKYCIHYPKSGSKKKIKITKGNRCKQTKGYGFAESGLKSYKEIKARLNWMNIPNKQRPKKLRGVDY